MSVLALGGAPHMFVGAPAQAPLPDGTLNGQPLVWNGSAWVPGDFIAFGAAPAQSGRVRVSAGDSAVVGRRFNEDNRIILAGATDIAFGEPTAGQASFGLEWGTGDSRVRYQGSTVFQAWLGGDSANAFGRPLVGLESASSPWGCHGAVDFTFTADANYTVTAAQYKYWWLGFNTGVWTAGHLVTFPLPASLSVAYWKVVHNNTTQTITVDNGGGGTRNLATTLAQWFRFDNAGVAYASPTWTP